MRLLSRRKGRPEPPEAESLAGYREYDTGSENRRLRWTAYTLAFAVSMLCLAVVALSLALYGLMPLKTVKPMLLTVSDRSDQVVHVEPFSQGTHGFRLLTEKLVRDYVRTAHTIVPDGSAMRELWGRRLFRFSSPAVFTRLRELFEAPAQAMVDDGLSRGVEILGDPRLIEQSGGRLYWQVSFETIDTRVTEELDRQSWVASLIVEFLPQQVTFEDRYINPIGFQVTGYTVARADSGDDG